MEEGHADVDVVEGRVVVEVEQSHGSSPMMETSRVSARGRGPGNSRAVSAGRSGSPTIQTAGFSNAEFTLMGTRRVEKQLRSHGKGQQGFHDLVLVKNKPN